MWGGKHFWEGLISSCFHELRQEVLWPGSKEVNLHLKKRQHICDITYTWADNEEYINMLTWFLHHSNCLKRFIYVKGSKRERDCLISSTSSLPNVWMARTRPGWRQDLGTSSWSLKLVQVPKAWGYLLLFSRYFFNRELVWKSRSRDATQCPIWNASITNLLC